MGRPVGSLAYPLHEQAVKRHVAWAREFASVGDVEAVDDELDDIRALTAELELRTLPALIPVGRSPAAAWHAPFRR